MPIVILTDEERIGTTLAGKYRLESILGRGGMGVVFAGTHTWTGRRVAVKFLNPTYAADPATRKRFFHEARAAASLRHPNVVEVLDMGEDEHGGVFLVLELLEGEPLDSYLERRAPLEPAEALEILLPITDAVGAVHEIGILHRDLKPDNVYLAFGREGAIVPKLLDFGIAKEIDAKGTLVTRAGTMVGTPPYMSPEQATGMAEVGRESDVWAMGVLLYESLAGELPFQGRSPAALIAAVMSKKPTPLATHGVPEPIAAVVDRALAREPEDRYATMEVLRAALVEAATSIGAMPDADRSRIALGTPSGTHAVLSEEDADAKLRVVASAMRMERGDTFAGLPTTVFPRERRPRPPLVKRSWAMLAASLAVAGVIIAIALPTSAPPVEAPASAGPSLPIDTAPAIPTEPSASTAIAPLPAPAIDADASVAASDQAGGPSEGAAASATSRRGQRTKRGATRGDVATASGGQPSAGAAGTEPVAEPRAENAGTTPRRSGAPAVSREF